MNQHEPNSAKNEGARAERDAFRKKIHRMKNYPGGPDELVADLLAWIGQRGKRTAKKVGGLGRK